MWHILHSAYITKQDPTNNELTKVIHLVIFSIPTVIWFRWVSIQVPSQPSQTPCSRTWWAENVEWVSWKTVSSILWICYRAGDHHKHSWLCAQSHKWKSLHFFRSPMLQWVTTQEWTWHTEIHRRHCVSLSSQF